MEPKTIIIIAGEASGDLHAAHVVRALKKQHNDIFICGMGSRAMRAAGAKVVIDADRLAVVGITEAIAKVPRLLKAMAQLKRILAGLKPDLLILIDFPDFNLHMAAFAKKLGIPVLYYISPQIWAWRARRVKKIKARVDHMAVILPFEKAFYEHHGVPVTFVGHPLMDATTNRINHRQSDDIHDASALVALLPGSRDREVRSLLPIMLQTARLLQDNISPIRFVVSCAPSINIGFIQDIMKEHAAENVQISTEPVSDLFPRCHLAIVASGTVTLEAAIYGTPMVITYAVSPLSYWLGRALVDVDHIGLVNLIAQQRIVPELVQKEATPEAIYKAAVSILDNKDAYNDARRNLSIVKERLGSPGASDKVAQIATRLMGFNQAD